MSIRSSVYGLPEVNGLHKRASNLVGDTFELLGGMGRALTDLGVLGSTYLIATALAAGTAVGWAGSKILARSPQDMDTARKAYENERLKADIGYLSGKLRQEQEANANMKAPKAARIIG